LYGFPDYLLRAVSCDRVSITFGEVLKALEQEMKSFGETIRKTREQRNLAMRVVAELLHIDPSLLSRIERDVKRPTRRQVVMLAAILDTDEKDLMVDFLSDKIIRVINTEPLALSAIRVAEEKIRFAREQADRERSDSDRY
jgi:transcriptional regulator with XRE-family HTH domain